MTQTDITSFGPDPEPHIIHPENEQSTTIFSGEISTSIIEPLARYVIGATDTALVVITNDNLQFITRDSGRRTDSLYASATIPSVFWNSFEFNAENTYIGGIITRESLYDAFTGDTPENTTLSVSGPTTTASDVGNPFENTQLPERTTSHDVDTAILDELVVNDMTSSVLRDPPGRPMELNIAHTDTVTLRDAYQLKKWLQKHGDEPEKPRVLLTASNTYNRDRGDEYMFTVTEFDGKSREATSNTYTATGSNKHDDVISDVTIYSPSTPSLGEREHIPDPQLEARNIHWAYYNYDEFAGMFTHALKDTLTDTEITLAWQSNFPVRVRHEIAASDSTPDKAVFEMYLAPMIT